MERNTILVVDDVPENRALMNSILKGHYRIKVASNGKKALDIAFSDDRPDLIILDIMMPEMDGYETCSHLKNNPKTSDIPVIFLTSKSQIQDEQKGFDLGAVDYIIKPISPPIVLARVKTHLQLKKMNDFLKDKNAFLEQEILRRTKEISNIQDVTFVAMGSLAETRDNETGNHIRRTQHYLKLLATKLVESSRYRPFLSEEYIMLLYKSAPLHDIGKVGIPDRILLKPGKLTFEEFEVMKTHTTIGRNSILAAEQLLDTQTSFLKYAHEIAYTHHEKWDGTGYPEGLSGDAIPVSGRLMALVDVYDALISKRVYKPAFPHEKAVTIIKEGSGNHFDPEVVNAFLEINYSFFEIAQKFMD
ncbi:MAG: two-component system response regulator [Desulfobacterales bacterium]|nr:two-component system response regulator [Desulfobacterales bacterium]